MAKAVTRAEVMAPMSAEEIAALSVEKTQEVVVAEAPPSEVILPEQEVVYLDRAEDLMENKKATKATGKLKGQEGLVKVCYTGNNPSYTLGQHRFRKNEVIPITKELAEYAMDLGYFRLEV